MSKLIKSVFISLLLFISVSVVKADEPELCGAVRYVYQTISDGYTSCTIEGYYEMVNGRPTNVNLYCSDGWHTVEGYYINGGAINLTIRISDWQILYGSIRY